MSSRSHRRNDRSASSSQLARQWGLLRLLESRPYSIRELADELGSSKASIQRDLTTLQQHFMIIARPDGAQKRVYRLERQRPPLAVKITRDELAALQELIDGDQTCNRDALRSLHMKLSVFLESG